MIVIEDCEVRVPFVSSETQQFVLSSGLIISFGVGRSCTRASNSFLLGLGEIFKEDRGEVEMYCRALDCCTGTHLNAVCHLASGWICSWLPDHLDPPDWMQLQAVSYTFSKAVPRYCQYSTGSAGRYCTCVASRVPAWYSVRQAALASQLSAATSIPKHCSPKPYGVS